MLFGVGNDRLFSILCDGLGKPEWAEDERFLSNSNRVRNRDILEKSIEDITQTKTTEEWLQQFDGTGLPYAKVNDLLDTVNHKHGKFHTGLLQKATMILTEVFQFGHVT